MEVIAIVTDSNSGITQDEAKKIGISILPMPFHINDELFYEGITLSQEKFYEKLSQNVDIVTSQPAPGDVMNLWDELLKTHDKIIHIPMSSGLSGSCATAKVLSVEYEGRVFVVDNKRISITQRQSVLDAIELKNQRKTAKEIAETLEKQALEASIFLAVDTLKYLKKGGRITPAVATVGSVLNIKPVLQIQGEKLDTFAKVRGFKQATKVMLDAIKKDKDERFKGQEVIIHVAYSGDQEMGKMWQKTVSEEFPNMDIHMDPLSLSVSCHVGPGTLGICCMKKLGA